MSVIRTKDRELPVNEALIAAIESEGLTVVLNGREQPERLSEPEGRSAQRISEIERHVSKPDYAANLRTFNEQWFFDDPRRLPSHRRLLGGLTARIRRWSLGALRILTFPTFERQRTFNSAVTQFLNELNATLLGAKQDFEHLFREQAALGRDLDEHENEVRRSLTEVRAELLQLVQKADERVTSTMAAAEQRIGSLQQEVAERLADHGGRIDENLTRQEEHLAETSRRLAAQEEIYQRLSHHVSSTDDRLRDVSAAAGQLMLDSSNLYHHLVNLGIIFRRRTPDPSVAKSRELQARYRELHYVRCLLCGADDTEPVGSKEGLRVVRCRSCGLMYVNPRLPAEVASELYSLDYWYGRQAEHGYSDIVERFAYDYILALGRLSLIRKYRLEGTLLDVGCSNGAFVRRANEWGFTALGLELDERIARLAERISGASVLSGPLEAQELPVQSLDVVTAFDLVEHLYDPFSFLNRVRMLLRSDGIFVFETFRTNVEAFSGDPEKHDDFKPLEHVYMYTEENLHTLLSRCGFDVVESFYPLGTDHSRVFKVCTSG